VEKTLSESGEAKGVDPRPPNAAPASSFLTSTRDR